MSPDTTAAASQTLIPVDVIPPGTLPPLRQRDLPPPVPLLKMIGPSVILAGLALGSGEYVIWPYITLKSQFTLFWACLAAVTMQYFLNMEIMRWTLATGESALTGIIRTGKYWAGIFLVLNIVPWMIPAWATLAAQIVGWLIQAPALGTDGKVAPGPYDTWLALASLWLCGIILTAGPVVYETVEKVQFYLVVFIIVAVIVLAAWLVIGRPDAVFVQLTSTVTLGYPQFIPPLDADLTPMMLLGALAFAGAGGTMNLCQSNYIRDKGYAMGSHVGRITSPITGNEEAITEIGYHFPHTNENLHRWRAWFRAAGWEHLSSFLFPCFVCLILLTLICYICFVDSSGQQIKDAPKTRDATFIWAEAERLAELAAGPAKWLFLLMGIAILFTTEFGVLDAASRISTDIVKVTWLRENARWSEGRLYFAFLWGEIALASVLLVSGTDVEPLTWIKLTAAMNGAVMFLYAALLMYVNRWRLPSAVRISVWRMAILAFTVAFFGAFTGWAAYDLALALYKQLN